MPRIKDEISLEQFRQIVASKGVSTPTALKPSVPNKFGAERVVNDDGKFDSGHEAGWMRKLLTMQAGGYLTDLVTAKKYLVYGIDVNGYHIARYTPDARFTVAKPFLMPTFEGSKRLEAGTVCVVDAKSVATRKKRDYQLISKLMLAVHNVEILEV